MSEAKKLDYTQLFGFDTVSKHIEDEVDFQDPTVGARLGAKSGPPVPAPEPTKTFMPGDAAPQAAEPGEPVMRGPDEKDA